MENWFIPTQAGPLPPARRVWVLAPHPDDEIFGPGGALRLYQASGAQVEVDILTDGTGYAQAHAEPAAAEVAEVAERRRAESRLALATLGIGPPQCWGLPDRGLVQQVHTMAQRIQARLQQASDEGRPIDVVFAPSLHEIHPDHNALIRATVRALLQLQTTARGTHDTDTKPAALPELLMYEVGAPLQPNLLVDISAVWADKRQAMQCFASQQARQDYARHVEGLNTYRSYYLGAEVRQAEAFRRVGPDALAQLDARLGDPLHGLGHPWHDDVLSVAQAQAEQLQDQLLTQSRLLAQAQAQLAQAHAQLAQAQTIQQAQQAQAQTQQQALLERFDREMLEARNALARQQQTLAELQWARDHGLAEKQALTRDLLAQQARYTQDVQQLQHDLARTQQDLARSQQDLQQLQQALQTATAAAAQSQAALQAVHTAWSWKLTAPLRRLRRLLG